MAKKGRSCELCDSEARMFCESDQARLCWDCDDKVHAANFLVAKHTRTALCHVCRQQTPWKASGPMLGRTVSVCGVCVARSARGGGRSGESAGVLAVEEDGAAPLTANVRIDGGDGTEDDEYESGDEEDISGSDDDDGFVNCSDDDDDDENQVVPWTSTPPSPPPASAASTSCSEEEDSASTSRFRDSPFAFRSNTNEIGARGSSSSSATRKPRMMPGEFDGDITGGGFGRPTKYRRV